MKQTFMGNMPQNNDCPVWSFWGLLFISSETGSGSSYSLWALPDCSYWLGCEAWLVRLWGTQKTGSLSLKISRNTIHVFVVAPPHGRWGTWPCAHHSQVHCELCLWLSWSLAHSRESNPSYTWLGSIMDNIGVYYTPTFYMYKSRFRCATWA